MILKYGADSLLNLVEIAFVSEGVVLTAAVLSVWFTRTFGSRKTSKFSLLNPLLLHTLLFLFVSCAFTVLPYSPLFLQHFGLQKSYEERKQIYLLVKSLT